MTSAGQMAGSHHMARGAARSTMNAGQMRAFEVDQMGVINHTVNGIGNNMAAMDNPINQDIHLSSFGSSGISAPMVTSPGALINHMNNSVLDQPIAQQELISHQQQNIDGFDQMSPNIQEQTNTQLLEQIRQHPTSAGQMLNDIKSGSVDNIGNNFKM